MLAHPLEVRLLLVEGDHERMVGVHVLQLGEVSVAHLGKEFKYLFIPGLIYSNAFPTIKTPVYTSLQIRLNKHIFKADY